jgi:hypothetical protein
MYALIFYAKRWYDLFQKLEPWALIFSYRSYLRFVVDRWRSIDFYDGFVF